MKLLNSVALPESEDLGHTFNSIGFRTAEFWLRFLLFVLIVVYDEGSEIGSYLWMCGWPLDFLYKPDWHKQVQALSQECIFSHLRPSLSISIYLSCYLSILLSISFLWSVTEDNISNCSISFISICFIVLQLYDGNDSFLSFFFLYIRVITFHPFSDSR